MRKKYLNIGLIILLVVIWGNVIFKFFGKNEPIQLNDILNNQLLINENVASLKKKLPFEFNIINSDPFGESKTKIYRKKNETLTTVGKEKSSIKKSIKFNWPNISYYGYVKNNINDTKLVLLKINNRVYRKRENELIDDLKIVKAYSDSLILSLNNEKKTILKSKNNF